jgi:hypothetical protein
VQPNLATLGGHNQVAIRRKAQGRSDFGFSILDFGLAEVNFES